MKKTLILITIFSFMSALTASSSYAMRHGGGHGHMGNNPNGCFNNLTPEEQTALKTEKTNFFKETRALRTDIFNKKMEMEQEFTNENPDSEKISSLRKEIFSLGKKLSEKRAKHFERINEILPGYSDCGMSFGAKHHKFRGNGGCKGFMGASYN